MRKKNILINLIAAGLAFSSLTAQAQGKSPIKAHVALQNDDGMIHLLAKQADGAEALELSSKGGLENWNDKKQILKWKFKVTRPGAYSLQIINEKVAKQAPHQLTYEVAGFRKNITLKKSVPFFEKGDPQPLCYSMNGATINFYKEGIYEISLKLRKRIRDKRVSFRKLRFVPYFNNRIGTAEHQRSWKIMHHSSAKQETMKWFKDAKYGMFIHWGLYSQAGGIWKGKKIEKSPFKGPRVAEWLMSTFRIKRADYAQLSKTFNPDANFADAIAQLAKASGMKYIVITAKHHDGFALYDSQCSKYDMVDSTPYKKDAIKELYDACQKHGLEFGIYYSHGNDWYDGTDGNFANDKKSNASRGLPTRAMGKNTWDPSPNTFDEYVENKSLVQIKELVTMLPNLKLIWFDGAGAISEQQSWDFYRSVYEINPRVLVSRRIGYGFGDYEDAGDNKIPAEGTMRKHWETVGTANNSWGYKSYDKDWKPTKELLYWFLEICSKGGNYMLNIGPDGKGHCPQECADRLRAMGDWISVNSDAIYGTKRWKVAKEGPLGAPVDGTGKREKHGFNARFSNEDFWFTSKGNKVYAIALVNNVELAKIKSLKLANGKVKSVRLLGNDAKLNWQQGEDYLQVDMKGIELGKYGYALEVTF